jgi:hypothetical protein
VGTAATWSGATATPTTARRACGQRTSTSNLAIVRRCARQQLFAPAQVDRPAKNPYLCGLAP